ncbi:MAG: hypothetical protein IPN62_01685 [Flavobacteriales bacterium]|nr:hypothetical protein [Flavobacteriales bacterium]
MARFSYFLHPVFPQLRCPLLAIAMGLACVVMGQSKFTVNGRMKVESGDMSNTRVVVYKNGVKERTLTNSITKFSLDLDLNSNYIVSFEKDGYVSKKISFNTKVPSDQVSGPFTPFDFAVSIFKQYDETNMVVFNQPVGLIRFEPSLGDFDYDTDYTRSIQSQLQAAQKEVEQKQKAEAQEELVNAKTKAAAEAEARKQAEQAAKDEQARVSAAKKEEAIRAAEQARQEAEARKAAERAALEARKPAPKPEQPPPTAPKAKPTPPEPKPERPIPTPPRSPEPGILANAVVGQDTRRATVPVVKEEAPPADLARTGGTDTVRPHQDLLDEDVVRHEELVVEPNKVVTIVKLEKAGGVTEYRKVFHKWGGTFYFKNGEPCSQLAYDTEARAEQLAGATPGGR